jgi:hypothetical protein
MVSIESERRHAARDKRSRSITVEKLNGLGDANCGVRFKLMWCRESSLVATVIVILNVGRNNRRALH